MINWDQVQKDLGVLESPDDPEAIIHEIVHAYDCVGAKAFVHVGSQIDVNFLFNSTYKTVTRQDNAEIRVSALTHLVMQNLGLPDRREDILDSMFSNLQRRSSAVNYQKRQDWVEKQFAGHLVYRRSQKTARVISDFLSARYTKASG